MKQLKILLVLAMALLVLCMLPISYGALTDNLVAYWTLDDADLTGVNYSNKVTPETFAFGDIVYALYMDRVISLT